MLTAIGISLVVGLLGGWFLCGRYGAAAKTLAAQAKQIGGTIGADIKKL